MLQEARELIHVMCITVIWLAVSRTSIGSMIIMGASLLGGHFYLLGNYKVKLLAWFGLHDICFERVLWKAQWKQLRMPKWYPRRNKTSCTRKWRRFHILGKRNTGRMILKQLLPCFWNFVIRYWEVQCNIWHTFENTYLHMSHCIYNTYSEGECVAKDGWKSDTKILAT